MKKTLWDRMARSYDARFRSMYDGIFETLRSEVTATDEVVEIGCGSGLVSFEIIPRVRTFVGSDLSSAMIDVAKAKLETSRFTNATFMAGDAMHMQDKYSFDKVLLVNLLHVVDDPVGMLARAKLLVKPGGKLLVVSYCHGEKMSLKYAFMSRLMRAASALGLMPKLSKFTFDGLRAVANEAGCRIEAERASTRGFPFLFMGLAA
jgi:ubiquinone/menaquinone biosynthesis C-methylase UbiE